MKLGLQIIRFDWADSVNSLGKQLVDIAQFAEEVDFTSLWVMDHFFQMGGEFGSFDDPMLEGYSTIAYLAGVTRKIRLGVLVAANIYHYPGVLVKKISTLDVLSGGRIYFGIGAGWYEKEARGFGIPYPTNLKEQFDRLQETLEIAKHMWGGCREAYSGQYYQLYEPVNSPAPIQSPHPPILIGGEGEKKTLRLVAQYGDACNLYAGGSIDEYTERVESVRHKLEVLKIHCQEVGRSYAEIEKTALVGVNMTEGQRTIEEIKRLCESLGRVGIQHIIFNMPNGYSMKSVEILAKEIVPIVSKV